jgi:acylphosphatase
MAQKKVKIKIYGNVQGVFYRQSAQEKAKELGIVSCETINVSDGTVEIYVSLPESSGQAGETKQIEEFIEWCKTGPKTAKVEKIEVTDVS